MMQAMHAKTFRTLFVMLLGLLGSHCSTKQPEVSDQKFAAPSVDHARFTDPCSACHEYRRLGPTTDIDFTTRLATSTPHGFGRDCAECHKYDTAGPSWKPISYTHNPAPRACLGCHSITTEGNRHEARGDCANCHTYPLWKTIGKGF